MVDASGSLLPRRRVLGSVVPAVLLVLLVSFAMHTSAYVTLGFQLIFGSFGIGVVSVLLSPVLYLLRADSTWATALCCFGGSLAAGAVLLYLRFGCVFGCPA